MGLLIGPGAQSYGLTGPPADDDSKMFHLAAVS